MRRERKQSNTVVMVTKVTKNNVRLCEKYSKINHFQRVFAYGLRFVHNISSKIKIKENV